MHILREDILFENFQIFISSKYFFSSYNDDLSIFLQPLNIV